MTAFLVAAALLALVVVGPAVYEAIVYRRRADAIDEQQSDAYWTGLAATVDWHARTAQQARRDYEASRDAGYVESLADYDLRRHLHTRREQT